MYNPDLSYVYSCSQAVINQTTTLNTQSRSLSPTHFLNPSLANADSGTTGNYMCMRDMHRLVNVQPNKEDEGISVHMPNGSIIKSTHTAQLNLPSLPMGARVAHIFPELAAAGSLLSIGTLCDYGCTAIFTSTTVEIKDMLGEIILIGTRSATTRLWMIDLDPKVSIPTTYSGCRGSASQVCSAANTLELPTQADRVRFYHACMGYPCMSTFIAAAKAGFLTSFPVLSPELIRKYPPHDRATAMGHLDRQRANVRSTKRTLENPSAEEELDRYPVRVKERTNIVLTKISDHSGHNFVDGTGRFPVPSSQGNQYVLVMYSWDSNYIHHELMKNRSAVELTAAYKRGITFYATHGFKPSFQRIDNEAPQVLLDFMRQEDISFQKAPPNMHRRNTAERCIRTSVNHIISMLSGTDPSFPLHLWDKLFAQGELTLNLMRASRSNPKVSAWEEVCGAFDFNATPLAPVGMRIVAHEPPEQRPAWAPHGVDGFYIGPALDHYRCYLVWIKTTRAMRVTDSIEWFPYTVRLPQVSQAELCEAAARDLVNVLHKYISESSGVQDKSGLTNGKLGELQKLAEIFSSTFPAVPREVSAAEQRVVMGVPEQRVEENSHIQRMPPPPLAGLPPAIAEGTPSKPIAPVLGQENIDEEGFEQFIGGRKAKKRREKNARQNQQVVQQPIPPPPVVSPAVNVPASSQQFQAQNRSPAAIAIRSRRARAIQKVDRFVAAANAAFHQPTQIDECEDSLLPNLLTAYSTTDIRTGKPLKYKQLIEGPDKDKWLDASVVEFDRLFGKYKAMHCIPSSQKPHNKRATYYNPQCAQKIKDDVEIKRVRGTVGGNLIDYPGVVSAATAALPTIKLLLNAVVSESGAKFMTVDITDYYLNSVLPEPEYMWIDLEHIPQCIREKYNVDQFAEGRRVLVEITGGMYGLPQAGLLAQTQLIAHLEEAGYMQCKHTPALFKHKSRPIAFTLVVDDFGVKYNGLEHAEHLLETLRKFYIITVNWEGSKYIGLQLDWDYQARTVALSMPDYVRKALARFDVVMAPHATNAPTPFTPPRYGQQVQLTDAPDQSPLLSPEKVSILRQIVGVFLYYARAIDCTMLVGVGQLSTAQTKATTAVEAAAALFLQYAGTWPNATVVYRASGMVLRVHSDASYLSEPNARSRAGGLFYLGEEFNVDNYKADSIHPSQFNGPVHVLSTVFDVVVASAAESEYGALFLNAKDAVSLRDTLEDLGYPQGATPIQTDNKCALGLATGTVKQRRSKAIDGRFHWIRDRVKQGQFKVYWRKGTDNLADFFTKRHSAAHHMAMRPFYVVDNRSIQR